MTTSDRDQLAILATDAGWTVTTPFTDLLEVSKGNVSVVIHFDHRDHSVLTASMRVYEYPIQEDRDTPIYRRQFVYVHEADKIARVASELENHTVGCSSEERCVTCARRRAQIFADLQEAVDAKFEDGGSVLEYILLTSPALKAKLSAAITTARSRAAEVRQPAAGRCTSTPHPQTC